MFAYSACKTPEKSLNFDVFIRVKLKDVRLASNGIAKPVIASIVELHFHGNLPRKLMPQASTPNVGYIFLRSLFTYEDQTYLYHHFYALKNPQCKFLTSLNLSFL